MIIKQRFDRGCEIENGAACARALLKFTDISDAIVEVLKGLYRSMEYEKFFVLEVDTEELSANVLEVV